MSFEQNKAIVRRFLEDIVNRGQFEIAEEIFAVDYINHTAGGGIGSGRDGFVKSIKAARAAFPDWTVTVNAMIADAILCAITSRFAPRTRVRRPAGRPQRTKP